MWSGEGKTLSEANHTGQKLRVSHECRTRDSAGNFRATKKSVTPIVPPGRSIARALSIAANQSGIIVSE